MQNLINVEKLYTLKKEASYEVLLLLLKIYFKDLKNDLYALETLNVMGLADESLKILERIQIASYKLGTKEIELLSKHLKTCIEQEDFENAKEIIKKMKEARTQTIIEIKKLD